jgi:hypothetical protein
MKMIYNDDLSINEIVGQGDRKSQYVERLHKRACRLLARNYMRSNEFQIIFEQDYAALTVRDFERIIKGDPDIICAHRYQDSSDERVFVCEYANTLVSFLYLNLMRFYTLDYKTNQSFLLVRLFLTQEDYSESSTDVLEKMQKIDKLLYELEDYTCYGFASKVHGHFSPKEIEKALNDAKEPNRKGGLVKNERHLENKALFKKEIELYINEKGSLGAYKTAAREINFKLLRNGSGLINPDTGGQYAEATLAVWVGEYLDGINKEIVLLADRRSGSDE